MGIVEEAQAQEEETSGAVQGGATAAFLSEDAEQDGEALLDSLQRDEDETAAVREKARGEADETGDVEADATEVVRELVEESPQPPSAATPATEVPDQPEGHDASMIDDLLASDDEDEGAARS